jgi:hypothetical protein
MAASQSDLLVPGMLMRSGWGELELPLKLLLLLPACTAVNRTLEQMLSSCECPGSVVLSSKVNFKSAATAP